ncbi:MAG: hypothetical protein H6753_05780 [Candidatus Omnitrophica bacterium]|nr:hypothetical protein [Candidatus Omnitrophota bacterium]
MKPVLKRFGVILFLLWFSGCTTRLVDFTMISTKNIDLSRSADFRRAQQRVKGKDEAMIIIFIPTGVPNMKEAIDHALESVPGAVALVDGVVYQEAFWFIIGTSSYVVEGTPIIDTTLASAELESPFMVARLDRRGKVKDFQYVSGEEFAALQKKYISKNQMKL